MARLIDRSFDPNRPVKVRRFFVAAGRHWEPGRLFPWRNMALAQRRVKLLFEAGKLMHSAENEEVQTPAPEPTPAPAPAAPVAAPEAAEAPTPEPVAAPKPAPAPESVDELDELNMSQLREIAERENAPFRVSRDAQRAAIRENRLSKG